MVPALRVDFDDAGEFRFDVGGEAEIQSCKQEFTSNIDANCQPLGLFADEAKCRYLSFVEIEYQIG